MTPFTVQTVFLLYSAISFLSALLIGALFWGKKDFSAKLWLWGCLLTSTATAVTVFRSDIPLIISFSLMVSFETLSIFLLGESLRQLGDNSVKIKLNKLALIIPVTLFMLVEIERSSGNAMVSPMMSASATSIFGLANLFCLYQAWKVSQQFTSRFFLNFLIISFAILFFLYLFRVFNVLIGYSGYTFDIKIFNVVIWFLLALFGSIRNLAYIVLRLHLGFSEYKHLNNMNLKLANVLEERNQMILSLERLNKSAAINAIASTVAHEINQPLGASRLNAQYIQKKLETEPNNTSLIKEVINSILHDIDRASLIVKNLTRLNQSSKHSTSTINLFNSINEVAEICKNNLHNLKINLKVDCPSNYLIKINLSEWQQVLINIINNAIDSLKKLGKDQREIIISAKKKNGNIEIFILDNGAGILAGQESNIFELMVTNKAAGTGIGLWLAKNIISRNGGDIVAMNIPNSGACFIIKLPSG